MKDLNKKVVLVTIGALIFSMIIYSIGHGSAKVTLGKAEVTYHDIDDKLTEKKDELASLEKKVNRKDSEVRSKIIELENQLTGKEKEVNEALDLVKQKDSINAELDKLKSELITVTENVKAKKTELASIDVQIKAKNEAPIS